MGDNGKISAAIAPLRTLTQFSVPSRGPNPGSCFSSLSSRLQRFEMLREGGGKEVRTEGREGSDELVSADLKCK